MELKVNVSWDEEASVYVAICDKIGLALESESYDKLVDSIISTVPELIELNKIDCAAYSFITKERRFTCA